MFLFIVAMFFLENLKNTEHSKQESVIVQTFFGLNKFLHSTEKEVCLYVVFCGL